jgi:TrpR-related protein YerC/YecD
MLTCCHMSTTASEARHELDEIPGLDELAAAFLRLRNRDEAKRFLRDLCTLGELEALAHRWQIVRLLEEGRPYLEIAERVHTSTATVTRVAQWLHHGTGGYRVVLGRTR